MWKLPPIPQRWRCTREFIQRFVSPFAPGLALGCGPVFRYRAVTPRGPCMDAAARQALLAGGAQLACAHPAGDFGAGVTGRNREELCGLRWSARHAGLVR